MYQPHSVFLHSALLLLTRPFIIIVRMYGLGRTQTKPIDGCASSSAASTFSVTRQSPDRVRRFVLQLVQFGHGTRTTLLLFTCCDFRHKTSHDFFSTFFPFRTILDSIIQILITADSKDTTLFEFLGQRNDVVVEEPDFAFVPLFLKEMKELEVSNGKNLSGK